MVSILLLGLFIGMQHALEADHVAAVASIAVRRSSVSRIVRHGAVWGIGHTITLMIFAGAALFLDQAIEEALSTILELCVGLLLVGLGSHLFYRLWRDRVHFHTHRHANGVRHIHAHSHRDEREDHASSEHNHAHPSGVPLKTLLVGMMQGLAGSAVLLVLTTATVNDPVTGMMYIAMFGFGSVLGMAALSVFIAIPLSYSAFALTWVNRGLQVVVGGTTVILGLAIVLRSAPI